MKKQILLVAGAFVAFVVLVVALQSGPAYDVKVDGIYYNLDRENKTASVTYEYEHEKNRNSYIGNVSIPSSFTFEDVTYTVTSIGDYAFCYCEGLTSVDIPNSVTSIGKSAFSNCNGLTYMIIPNSVTSIGDGSFSNCYGLTYMNIPNSVTSIGNNAFWYCSGLTFLAIPNSVTSIGNSAFGKCGNLITIHSFNPIPPSADSDSFDEDYCYQNATLYVPYEAVEAYKTTEPWKNFMNIRGSDETGIETIKDDGSSW